MLVSVLIPTRERPAFLANAVRMFLAQDWPLKELLVIGRREDIGEVDLSDPQIRFIEMDASIGAALNEAIRNHAKGEICVRFDDDDWQSLERISLQVGHIQGTGRAVVGLSSILLYAEGREHGWRVYDRLQHSAGAALAFTREWALAHPFREARGATEDTPFVEEALAADEYSGISGFDILVMSCHPTTSSHRPDPEIRKDADVLESTDNWYKIPLEKFAHIIEGRPLPVADAPENCPQCHQKGMDVSSHADSRQMFICVNGCEDVSWSVARDEAEVTA